MNYSTVITAEKQIPCTKQEFDKILAALESTNGHGFSAEWDKNCIYLFASETGNQEELPDVVVDALCDLMKAAGMEYLGFGAGMQGGRPAPESSGGYYFRIYRDGAFIYQECKWPEHNPLGDDEFRCTGCGGIFDIEDSLKLGGKKGDLYCEKCFDGRDDDQDDDEVQHDKDVKNGLHGNDGSPGDPDVGLKDESGEYISIEECRQSGIHLTSCDEDGYCNFCGEQKG